jgi:1-deoxy-D-xylulose-5-phosphate reductoisomerase
LKRSRRCEQRNSGDGRRFRDAPGDNGVKALPVDSEHNAIFQCFEGKNSLGCSSHHFTAFDGPFREMPRKDFDSITLLTGAQASDLEYGPKITIDSQRRSIKD